MSDHLTQHLAHALMHHTKEGGIEGAGMGAAMGATTGALVGLKALLVGATVHTITIGGTTFVLATAAPALLPTIGIFALGGAIFGAIKKH